MIPPIESLRFAHPVLEAAALGTGSQAVVELLGRRFELTRDGSGEARVRALGDELAVRVIEQHRFLWIALASGANDVAEHDYSSEGFEQVAASVTRFHAPLHVAFDNFSEDEHTPWVHTFLGWRASDAGTLAFETSEDASSTHVYYRGVQRPHALTPTILVRWGDHFHNRWQTKFDPPRTVYTLHWTHPRTGARRPVTARFAIYFVAETARTTLLCTLAFAKVSPGFGALMPVVRRYVPRIGKSEIEDDMSFVSNVRETPYEFTGMSLGKYDKPLVHNRKLMNRIYMGLGPQS